MERDTKTYWSGLAAMIISVTASGIGKKFGLDEYSTPQILCYLGFLAGSYAMFYGGYKASNRAWEELGKEIREKQRESRKGKILRMKWENENML